VVKNDSLNFESKYFDKTRMLYPNTFISDDQIKSILNNCATEGQLKTIFYYMSLALKTSPNIKEQGNLFFNSIDNSQYNISQWIEAVITLHEWLLENSRKSDFAMILGYIQCCGQSPENKVIKYQLKDLVTEMLNTHGFNG
jgi:hypothetical protein